MLEPTEAAASLEREEAERSSRHLYRRVGAEPGLSDKELLDREVREVLKGVKERYKAVKRHGGYREGGEYAAAGTGAERPALPTLADPKLFQVKCLTGKERMLCFRLMRKFFDEARQGRALPIFSVTSLDHVEGSIYIEARDRGSVVEVRGRGGRGPSVRRRCRADAGVRRPVGWVGGPATSQALQGVRGVNYSKVKMVPLEDMPDVLRVRQIAGTTIKPGAWVRVKRGVYAGDLGQVGVLGRRRRKKASGRPPYELVAGPARVGLLALEQAVAVDEVAETVTVKLVPRLDLLSLKDGPTAATAVRAPRRACALKALCADVQELPSALPPCWGTADGGGQGEAQAERDSPAAQALRSRRDCVCSSEPTGAAPGRPAAWRWLMRAPIPSCANPAGAAANWAAWSLGATAGATFTSTRASTSRTGTCTRPCG